MTEMPQLIQMQARRADIGARITGTPAGPVPTVTLSAGPHVSVEVDPTNVTSPVAIDIWDLEAADTDLRDLLGSNMVDQLWSLSVTEPTTHALDFTPTAAWTGIAALALQLWNDRWNVFPLDRALTAVDKLAAASSAGPFGAKIARETLPSATPAMAEMKARQDHGELTSLARASLNQALASARKSFSLSAANSLPPLEDNGASLPMLLESRVGGAHKGANRASIAVLSSEGGPVKSLEESADWRLTGLGMASTAEGMLRADYVGETKDLVRMSIPAQEPIPTQNRSDEPYYQGIITDPTNGEVLAFVHMALNLEGTKFEGTGNLARALEFTDLIDIRHPLLNEPVQQDLKLRHIDKVRRIAARAFAVERLAAAAGEPVAEAVGILEKAWGLVAKEASILQRHYPQFREAARGWINVSKAHQYQVLADSPNHWDREHAAEISEGSLLTTSTVKVLPATLGELGYTGHLYPQTQKE